MEKEGLAVGVSAGRHRGKASTTCPRVLLALLLVGAQGCLVKKTVRVPVAPGILAAKTATLDQLLSDLDSYSEKITSLSSATLKVSFTSGKVESGKLQAYRSAPGYILLKRPDSIRLNIQNPITKTSLVELTSVDDVFHIWYPRENKFFTGSNSAREFDLEGHPGFTARPVHIFDAILPQKMSLAEPGRFVAMEQEQDATTKYYVLSFLEATGEHRLRPLRQLWVDRSVLAVTRQQVFSESGAVVSDIHYSTLVPNDGLLLPLSIHIERPLDGYTLDLKFGSWRLNPELPDNAFVLTSPPGAEIVQLKEKGRSEEP